MRAELSIDTDRPDQMKTIVGQSLDSTNRVNYTVKAEDRHLSVTVETDSLGVLRGCTDTVFRLTSLTEKLY